MFSPSVRQDLLQVALAKLLGQTIQSPSIHLHERKIAVSIDGSAVDEALLVQFKQMTGFDVEWKNGSGNSSSALAQQEVFQANTTSKRMENNQAIEEAKRWAIERGITMYKASINQQGSMMIMEVHFISPEIAKQHEVDLTELSYRIGMPKQNEIN